MKTLYTILSLFILLAIASCGGTSRFSADYDDIYFSAKKEKSNTETTDNTITSISKNNEVINGTKKVNEKNTSNDVVVLKPYSRENNDTDINNSNNWNMLSDTNYLAGELEDQVVYIEDDDNIFDEAYEEDNVYKYLQEKEQEKDNETSYEERINKFNYSDPDEKYYSQYSAGGWASTMRPSFNIRFSFGNYYNPYRYYPYSSGFYDPFYSGYYDPFYSGYHSHYYSPFYGSPYSSYDPYYYGYYPSSYGYGSNYYNYRPTYYSTNYYYNEPVNRTRKHRASTNTTTGNSSRYSRVDKDSNLKNRTTIENGTNKTNGRRISDTRNTGNRTNVNRTNTNNRIKYNNNSRTSTNKTTNRYNNVNSNRNNSNNRTSTNKYNNRNNTNRTNKTYRNNSTNRNSKSTNTRSNYTRPSNSSKSTYKRSSSSSSNRSNYNRSSNNSSRSSSVKSSSSSRSSSSSSRSSSSRSSSTGSKKSSTGRKR